MSQDQATAANYTERLEQLMRREPESRHRSLMQFAETRMSEAGLLSDPAGVSFDSLLEFAHSLILDNPAALERLNLNGLRPPSHLESVEELVEELTAYPHNE